jgi:DNA-binding CsgD family transcriptional regulator
MANKFDFVTNLPGLVIVKDSHSVYLNISQAFAKILGWKSALVCAGKTDYEIPCKAVEFADEFIKMDKIVMNSNQRMLALDIQNYADGWKLVLVERNPLQLDNDASTGLFNHCIDVSHANLFRSYFLLHQYDNKLFGKSYKPVSYILNNTHCPLPLTEKQENCLFLLIRGKTFKEIAKILHISPRTVECHIDTLKNKLRCHYKTELIEKAIDSDFLYYIPERIQKIRLDEIIKSGT